TFVNVGHKLHEAIRKRCVRQRVRVKVRSIRGEVRRSRIAIKRESVFESARRTQRNTSLANTARFQVADTDVKRVARGAEVACRPAAMLTNCFRPVMLSSTRTSQDPFSSTTSVDGAREANTIFSPSSENAPVSEIFESANSVFSNAPTYDSESSVTWPLARSQ